MPLQAEVHANQETIVNFALETITISQRFTEKYKYYVYNWSGGASITTSQAEIRVYDETGLFKTYSIPITGDGRYWCVFDISETGQFIDQNIVQNSAHGLP